MSDALGDVRTTDRSNQLDDVLALPEQLSDAEVDALIDEAISSTEASSMKEMGAVMGAVMASAKGKVDGSLVQRKVRERLGGTDVLMNNAGIQPGSGIFGPAESWRRVLEVNLWGVIHGSQVFVPGMLERGRPGLVINTGSKQGITTPPGDPAYNIAKAGVKAFTEALQHDLRNRPDGRISAHLLIPGFVFTGLTAKGRAEKPAAAWTPEQTVDFMLERLEAGGCTLAEALALWERGEALADACQRRLDGARARLDASSAS